MHTTVTKIMNSKRQAIRGSKELRNYKTSCKIKNINISLSINNYSKYKGLHVCMLSHYSCVWLFWDSMDYSPPGSSIHGISQARILEGVAISFSTVFFYLNEILKQLLWITYQTNYPYLLFGVSNWKTIVFLC